MQASKVRQSKHALALSWRGVSASCEGQWGGGYLHMGVLMDGISKGEGYSGGI